jgi:Protein of unknown function (DUF2786)
MQLSSVLEKVRKLIAKAEDAATGPEEAQVLREGADRLMLKYAIDEAELEATRPAAARTKPEIITIELGSALTGSCAYLASTLARYCRCKIRNYTSYDYQARSWASKVYGYESDLRYFELLYTTLRLHMLGALRPGIDSTLSLDENCYRMHNAGYNWLEIAKMYGWRKDDWQAGDTGEMWVNEHSGERYGNHKVGSSFKRACIRACRARGEEHVRIAAGGSATYRASAAEGYTAMIWSRLRKLETGREAAGTALALRMDDLDELYRTENPDLFQEAKPTPEAPAKGRRRTAAPKPLPFNERAYAAGRAHAATADLMVGTRVSDTKKEIS